MVRCSGRQFTQNRLTQSHFQLANNIYAERDKDVIFIAFALPHGGNILQMQLWLRNTHARTRTHACTHPHRERERESQRTGVFLFANTLFSLQWVIYTLLVFDSQYGALCLCFYDLKLGSVLFEKVAQRHCYGCWFQNWFWRGLDICEWQIKLPRNFIHPTSIPVSVLCIWFGRKQCNWHENLACLTEFHSLCPMTYHVYVFVKLKFSRVPQPLF